MSLNLTLERRLLFAILVASSCVTAVLTVASMILDYNNEMKGLKNSATELQRSIGKPLGSLLYSGDEELIRIFAESILANRDIECVEIIDTYSKNPAKKWCDTDSSILNSYSVNFPLEFEGFSSKSVANQQVLGEIKLVLSDRHIMLGIKDRIITFVVTQASKTFIISFLILMIVRSLVVRHIRQICLFFLNYNAQSRGQSLVLENKLWVDELDNLVDSINSMLKEQENILVLSEEKEHSYDQLAKVFYPHQLEMMKRGIQLEMTMPTGRSEAVVLAFDIIGSSQIKSGEIKEYLRKVFGACSEAMMVGYNPELLIAKAFRIKEMGDGFICSIGFPFRQPTGISIADLAVELAEEFVAITRRISHELGFIQPIHCGIGIAAGEIEAFFPSTLPREFDLFGKAIVLATRYESSRHLLLEGLKISKSVSIIHENVFTRISQENRAKYTRYELVHWRVRDDADANCLYFRLAEETFKLDNGDSHLSAV